MVVGLLFGVAVIVLAIIKPAFVWNMDLVQSIRNQLGEVLTMVFLIGAGVVIMGSSLLLAGKSSRAR